MKFKDLKVEDDFIIVNLQKVLDEHGSKPENKKGMRALRLMTPKVDRDDYIVFSKTKEQSQTCCTPGFNCMSFAHDNVPLNQENTKKLRRQKQTEIVRYYSMLLDKETEVKKISSLIISEPNQQKVKVMNKRAGTLKPGDKFFVKNKEYVVSPAEYQTLEERVQCEEVGSGRQKTFGKKEKVRVDNPTAAPEPEKAVIEEIILEETVDETVEVEESNTESPWGYFRAVAEDIAEDDEKKEEE